MRKMILAFAVLIVVAAVQPLRAQQTSPATPAPAAGATGPGPVYGNITYGVAGGETLLPDVFEPANNSGQPRPAIVLVHGGGWTSFGESTMRPPAQFLALAGFVAVTVDYRLFHDDATRWPTQLDDVQPSVRWERANSAKYNVDPNHTGAYGHSAGGQIAVLLGMLETRDNSDAALAKYSSKVQAVVDATGPSEISATGQRSHVPRACRPPAACFGNAGFLRPLPRPLSTITAGLSSAQTLTRTAYAGVQA
jgi:acetyl esterase/lipase